MGTGNHEPHASPEAKRPKQPAIQRYEVPGAFELTATGRAPRFYDDARLAGEAFYAARREEQPRVVQHWISGFEDRTGRYENPSIRPIATTAPGDHGGMEHVFLADAPEFRAGYEQARQRMPDKGVPTLDLTQPTGATMDDKQPALERLNINGQQVQRLSFRKAQTELGLRYDIALYADGDKQIGKIPGLAKEELAARLGPTAARRVVAARGRNGSLRGDLLDVPRGESRHEGVIQKAAPRSPKKKQPHKAVNTIERMDAPGAAAEPDKRTGLEKLVDRYHADRVAERMALDTRRSRPAAVKDVRQDLAEQPAAPGAERSGEPRAPEGPRDLSEKRRQELAASLAERFEINGGVYRFREDRGFVAFVDRDKALTTQRDDPAVARAMVDLAESKGWTGLHLKGSQEFRAAAWMEAASRGLPSHGYEPTRDDLQRLAKRMEDLQRNRVEPARQAQQERPAQDRQERPEQPARRDEASQFTRKQALGVLEKHLRSLKVDERTFQLYMQRGEATLDKMSAEGKPLPQARLYDVNAQRAQPQVHVQPPREVAAPTRSR